MMPETVAFIFGGLLISFLMVGESAAEIDYLRAENEKHSRENKKLREVVLRVDVFIKNGVELGFIRIPDTPIDPAYHVPGIVSAAAAAIMVEGR